MNPPRLFASLVVVTVTVSFGLSFAQENPPPPEPPRVVLVAPLAVSPGGTVPIVLRLRGVGLAEASAVRFPEAKVAVTANVKTKGAAEIPQNLDGKVVGDSQVEVEVTLPPDAPAGPMPVVVVTPQGETAPATLLVVARDGLVEEKEPNDGFRDAQELTPHADKRLAGMAQQNQDVDVFRVKGRAGQKIVAEVTAARSGSLLDAALTVYDAAGHVQTTADDDTSTTPPTRDPVLRFTFPADGVYYLSLQDGHDRGGAGSHPYLLTLREEP